MPKFQDCFARFTPQSRILDVGCGIGDLTAEMSKQVPLGGVDSSYHSIVVASRRYCGADYPNLRFRPADATTLRFKEEPFDFVVSRGCLHFLPCPGACFPALSKHLRPGGCFHVWFMGKGNAQQVNLCLNELCRRESWKKYFGNFRPDWHFISPKSCEPWFEKARLKKNRSELIDHVVDFSSPETFLQWPCWGWSPYWERLPAAHHPQFNQELVDLYQSTEGSYRAHLVWLVIDATKF